MKLPSFDPAAPVFAFAKYDGAGNDFVLVDDPGAAFPTAPAAIAALCDRHTGIGADGLILLRPPTDPAAADVRMAFYNSDGSSAAMCGNGGRCLAAFAHAQGRAPAALRIQTPVGILSATVQSPTLVTLQLPPPSHERLGLPLDFDGRHYVLHHLDTGVPHAVLFLPADSAPAALDTFPVDAFGRFVRNHPLFAPDGANVDVVLPDPAARTLRIRTYERGVEAETLACGTGATAAAVLALRLSLLGGTADAPVRVCPRLPTALSVRVRPDNPSTVFLTGPVHNAFDGTAARPEGQGG